jgi:hypothetical protein
MKIFDMSDLALLSFYLGVEVRQDTNGITLRQTLRQAHSGWLQPCPYSNGGTAEAQQTA